MNRFRPFLIPLIIFVFALSLRFYHLPARFVFGTDEEYQAHYAMTLVRDFHPIWIGVSAADTGFYLGPYWTYFTALWLKLSGGDPLLTGYVSSFIGAINAVLLFYLLKRISSYKAGLVAGILYAFSPLMVYFDQKYWNPSTAPTLTLLILLCLSYSSPWLITLAFILYGFVWHVHLALVPLVILILVRFWQHRHSFRFKHYLVAIVGIILVLLPLLIFDYYHNYSNLQTPLRMLANPSSHSLNIGTHLSSFGSTLSRSLWLMPGTSNVSEVRMPCLPVSAPSSPILALTLFVVITLLYSLWKYRFHPFGWGLALFTLSYIFYPGDVAPYYLLGFFPLLFGAIALFITSIFSSSLQKLFVLIFVTISLSTLILANEQFGYAHKIVQIDKVKNEIGNQSYSLAWDDPCYTQEGWRYLFAWRLSRPATTSPVDGIFSWLYDQREVRINPTVMINLNPTDHGYAYQIENP